MKLPLGAILLAITSAFSCSDEPNEPVPEDTLDASAPDAGGDAAPLDCLPGTHVADDGSCETTLTWAEAGEIEPARDHHTSFIAERGAAKFLYVLGGMNEMTFLADVQRAAIDDDGGLADWEPVTELPKPSAGHAMAVSGDSVVVSGGFTSPRGALSVETYVSRIDADGSLAAWMAGPPLPSGRVHHTMAAHGSWLYSVGGQRATGSSAEVLRALVHEDGTLEAWEEATPLPSARSHHGSIVHEGAIYVVGGGNLGAGLVQYTDALRAVIADDGSLSAWTTVSTLSEVGTESVIEFAEHVYLIGGVVGTATGIEVLGRVSRAPWLEDGSLGAWEALPDLPFARGHVHQTPMLGQKVYSVGGAGTTGPLGTVLVGTFE